MDRIKAKVGIMKSQTIRSQVGHHVRFCKMVKYKDQYDIIKGIHLEKTDCLFFSFIKEKQLFVVFLQGNANGLSQQTEDCSIARQVLYWHGCAQKLDTDNQLSCVMKK